MTSSRGKKTSRERQCITRTACEACREKRAKCDGQQPCGRCQARDLDCRFVQRTWASKRSLQDETASLRKQLRQRDTVIEALSAPGSGDEVVRMLRNGMTCDEVFEKLGGGSRTSTTDEHDRMKTDMDAHASKHTEGAGSCECQKCWSPATTWSPSTITTGLSQPSQERSPFTFVDSESFPSNSPFEFAPVSQPAMPDQQLHSAPSIPWATQPPNLFDTVLDNSVPLGMSMKGGPSLIDPRLRPPMMGPEHLGNPYMNSWTGFVS